MLSVPMPARAMTLRLVAAFRIFLGHLCGGANRKAVVLADHFSQLGLVFAQLGLEIDINASDRGRSEQRIR